MKSSLMPGRNLHNLTDTTDSCLCRVSALLAELDDEWMTGKVYLSLNP